MFIEERQRKIIDHLIENGRCEVVCLAEYLDVSVDTIRRDLKQLEAEGTVMRTRGGALLTEAPELKYFNNRQSLFEDEKRKIGQEAASHIIDNDCLFLSGASTIGYMLEHLANFKNLIVCTDSVVLASDLINVNNKIQVYTLGGMVDPKTGKVFSINLLDQIKQMRIEKLFITPSAVTADYGLSSDDANDAMINKALVDAAQEVIVMVDRVKFTRRPVFQIAPLSSKFTIITDNQLDEGTRSEFEPLIEKGLKMILV